MHGTLVDNDWTKIINCKKEYILHKVGRRLKRNNHLYPNRWVTLSISVEFWVHRWTNCSNISKNLIFMSAVELKARTDLFERPPPPTTHVGEINEEQKYWYLSCMPIDIIQHWFNRKQSKTSHLYSGNNYEKIESRKILEEDYQGSPMQSTQLRNHTVNI